MALFQFTHHFVANLPSVNGINLKDFYEALLLRTPATHRIRFLAEIIDQQRDFLPQITWSHGKDDEKWQHFRSIGNECFVRLEFVEALKCYNRALCYARTGKLMGVCYANRSAVYYELSMFKICLENIQLARMYNLDERHKHKLDDRQEAAQTCLLSQVASVEPHRSCNWKLCRPPMGRQPFFINCLTKPEDEIVTIEGLEAGDIISLERPYSQLLSQSHIYERCTYCLTNRKFLSMIPCRHCSSAMFCDLQCYKMAEKMFHGFECPIIDGLFNFLPDCMYLGLRTVFTRLNECNGSLDEYRSMLMKCFRNEEDSFDVNMNAVSSSQSFNEMVFLIIHNMVRSYRFSLPNHIATAVLIDKLQLQFESMFDRDPNAAIVLSTSIFHMIHVSTEKSIVLEETAFSGSDDDDDDIGNDITVYGCGLFPFASNFKFSCSPNVLFLNNNGVSAGIVLHPIYDDTEIRPGIMSRISFLTDRQARNARMYMFNGELCHCLACRGDFDLLTDLPLILQYRPLPLLPEKFADENEILAALKLVCNYLNLDREMPYVSRNMGWCICMMIRLLRQLVQAHDADIIFTDYAKLIRNVGRVL